MRPLPRSPPALFSRHSLTRTFLLRLLVAAVVCDKLWPDYLKHYNNNNFWCKTDRESHCPPIPGEAKDCQGSSTGQFPGKGVPLEPFCSAGHDSRISSAVKGLSTPGPVQATYTAGQEVQLSWQVQSWSLSLSDPPLTRPALPFVYPGCGKPRREVPVAHLP